MTSDRAIHGGEEDTCYDTERALRQKIESQRVEIEQWRKYAEHRQDCACMDRMDDGRLFPRHDWPCSCGLRELQAGTTKGTT